MRELEIFALTVAAMFGGLLTAVMLYLTAGHTL